MPTPTPTREATAGPPTLRAATLCEAFAITARRHADGPALRAFGPEEKALSWREYEAQMRPIGAGLEALGVGAGDTVGIMLTNRPEFHLVDAAVMHLGAVPFSIYNTSAIEQIAHLLSDAGCDVVVAERRFLPRLTEVRAGGSRFEHVICVDGDADGAVSLVELIAGGDPAFDLDARAAQVRAHDVLTVIYTSGTTGPPKGVQITHANMLAELRAVHAAVGAQEGGRIISWLPAAHLAERWGSHYTAMTYGREVVCLADTGAILDALPIERPIRFGSVPRMWEKLRARVEAVIAGLPPAERDQAERWLAIALEKVWLEQAGDPVPSALLVEAALADEQLFASIRERIGLDRCRLCTTGAAPTPRELIEFFMAIGIPICEQWGMSETSCIATLNRPDAIRIGTAGTALPGVELRLAQDGELLVRGDIVMSGYRNQPELTAETIDGDGWLRTGDIAEIDADGYVRIVDRKKDLIINAAGKNMSPANIEARLKSASPLIGQACCIGDALPYNTALLVLDPDGARAFADDAQIDRGSLGDYAEHPAVLEAVAAAVAVANERLSRVEQIKRWTVLPLDWVGGGDELTPTMKLKRKTIVDKYAEEIAALYATP